MDSDAIVSETLDLLAQGEHCFVEAGKRILLLKGMRRNSTWEQFCNSVLGISRRWADHLIRIAEGKTTVETERAAGRQRQAKHMQKKTGVTDAAFYVPFLFPDKLRYINAILRNAKRPDTFTLEHHDLLVETERLVAWWRAQEAGPAEQKALLLTAAPTPERKTEAAPAYAL